MRAFEQCDLLVATAIHAVDYDLGRALGTTLAAAAPALLGALVAGVPLAAAAGARLPAPPGAASTEISVSPGPSRRRLSTDIPGCSSTPSTAAVVCSTACSVAPRVLTGCRAVPPHRR